MIRAENKYGHGALPVGKARRIYRKLTQPRLGRSSEPFDWSKGFDIESSITISRKDQGGSFSCSGQAGSYFLEAQRKLAGINDVLSAKSIYAPIHADGGGASVDALETRVAVHGANLQHDVPDSISEAQMEDDSFDTPYLESDALKRAGYTPTRVPVDIDSIAEIIRDFGGVIIELAGQNNGTWLSQFPQPPSKAIKSEVWYHFMYFKGAKMIDGKKYLLGLNSWGTDTG